MKKTLLMVFATTLLFSFSMPLATIKIKGSDTLLPLAQKWAEVYMKSNSTMRITVTGGGSGVGIAALIDGTTDIAATSRKIKMDERLKLQEAGKSYKEVIVANDALSVIVNPSNKVTKLTREQLEGIFTGKYTNWKQVGGDDMKIVAYSRESSSGTFEFFKEKVLNKKNFASTCLMMPSTGSIVQSVSQTKGAIGYIGMAYINSSVKSLSVSFDKGTTYVKPSLQTAINKTYPIVRPLYFYYLTKSESIIKPFLTWVISGVGQNEVKNIGYVPLQK